MGCERTATGWSWYSSVVQCYFRWHSGQVCWPWTNIVADQSSLPFMHWLLNCYSLQNGRVRPRGWGPWLAASKSRQLGKSTSGRQSTSYTTLDRSQPGDTWTVLLQPTDSEGSLPVSSEAQWLASCCSLGTCLRPNSCKSEVWDASQTWARFCCPAALLRKPGHEEELSAGMDS